MKGPVQPRKHEYRLEKLRRWAINCGCNKYPCQHTFYEGMLYSEEDAYAHHKALRGAYEKGMAAWRSGERWTSNPYGGEARTRDRNGRANRGFAAAFEKAWDAGWAWAEYSDPSEVVMRALEASQDQADWGGCPGCPNCWRRGRAT